MTISGSFSISLSLKLFIINDCYVELKSYAPLDKWKAKFSLIVDLVCLFLLVCCLKSYAKENKKLTKIFSIFN